MQYVLTRKLIFRQSISISANRTFSIDNGLKVPINYVTSGKDPVIKEDKEYPDWVFQLGLKVCLLKISSSNYDNMFSIDFSFR